MEVNIRMVFIENVCCICETEYSYDTEASPKFCALVCSQGCNEKLEEGEK